MPAGRNLSQDGGAQRDLLAAARVIAVVGHSDKPHRTSYRIANYLRGVGYSVYPVNPTITQVDGETSYPSLAALPEAIDIVNVFRRSVYLPGVVEEAIAAGAKAVWAQLGVHDHRAVEMATAAGLDIVTNTCIRVSHLHYVG